MRGDITRKDVLADETQRPREMLDGEKSNGSVVKRQGVDTVVAIGQVRAHYEQGSPRATQSNQIHTTAIDS